MTINNDHNDLVRLEARHRKVQTETGLVWIGDAALMAHMAAKDLADNNAKAKIWRDDEAMAAGIRDGRDLQIRQGLAQGDSPDKLRANPLQITGTGPNV
jgi:hypothetical protein